MTDFRQRWLRRLRSTVVVGAWLYCIGILYFAIVWTWLPQKFWWIAFTNLFAALFFLPLLILLPLLAMIRTRRMAIAVGLPSLAFILLFGGLFLPRWPQVNAAGEQLRVVSINQFFGNQQYDALLSALSDSDADLIAIQELSPEVALRIEQQLGERFPYRWLLPADHAGGIGLISRYPLHEQRSILSGRGQQVTLELEQGRVTLVNVHLHFNSINRRNVIFWGETPILAGYDSERLSGQVQALLEELAAVEGALMLVGDFNMGDREPGYRLLSEHFRDAFREAGWGFGFSFPNHKSFGPLTVPVPLVRLDYSMLRGPIVAHDAAIDCRRVGADHCMLRTDVQLTAE